MQDCKICLWFLWVLYMYLPLRSGCLDEHETSETSPAALMETRAWQRRASLFAQGHDLSGLRQIRLE